MDKIKRVATTVYLNPRIAKAAKVRAALSDKSLSDLVNEALAKRLRQDADDLELIRIRKRSKEPFRDYDDVVKDMKRDGLL
jgi:hypothetical protein